MNRSFKIFLVLLVLLMSCTGVWAQEKTAYAKLSSNNDGDGTKTLTFRYEVHTVSVYNDWDVSNTGEDNPDWCSDKITRVVFDKSFADARPKSCVCWFSTCNNLATIEGIEYLNTSEVTSMRAMFGGCSKLTSLDVSHFNTSKVTSLAGMFSGCSGLTSLDLSNFDTGNVTNMQDMFLGCTSLQSITFGDHFNTSSVTSMQEMFYGCSNLQSLDLSSFNTSKVTTMYWMFKGCSSLTSLDLSSLITNKVATMNSMFESCTSLQSLSIGTGFYVANGINVSDMFAGCDALKSGTLRVRGAKLAIDQNIFSGFTGTLITDEKLADNMSTPFSWKGGTFSTITHNTAYAALSGEGSNKTLTFKYGEHELGANEWDVTYIESGQKWYDQKENITQVVFDPSFADARPKNCYRWFFWFTNLTSITGVEYFNTSSVTSMQEMFYGCSKLTSLDVSHFNTCNVTDMEEMFSGCSSLTSLDVSNFNTSSVTNMYHMFNDCENLTSLDLSTFNTSNVTNMKAMFTLCGNLKKVDVSHFNTSNVTEMDFMFSSCYNLKSLDLSNFDTGNVTDMQEMFRNCYELTYIDLSSFNTGKVENMYGMFIDCKKLGCLNIGSGFTVKEYVEYSSNNLAGKTYTVNMFQNCSSLADGTLIVTGTTAPTIDASQTGLFSVFTDGTLISEMDQNTLGVDGPTDGKYSWNGGAFSSFGPGTAYAVLSDGILTFKYDVHTLSGDNEWNATNGRGWTSQASSVTKVVFEPSFAVVRPTSLNEWFRGCNNLKTIEGIVNLNTSEVIYMEKMFYECKNLQSLDLNSFNTNKVESMEWMFYECNSLKSLDLRSFDTRQMTKLSRMFHGCDLLESVDLSSFNTSNVTEMQSMFYQCNSLKNIDLSNFNTSNVTTMYAMFEGCRSLTSLDVSNFDTRNVIKMDYMFNDCSGLKSLDLSNFDTGNVTDMDNMFSGCSGLTTLDLSNFDTGNVTEMGGMFQSCTNLTTIYLGSFNTSNVTDMHYMFHTCKNLPYLDLSTFNTGNVNNMSGMFADCEKLKSLSIGEYFSVKPYGTNKTTETYTDDMFRNCKALADGQLILMVMGTDVPNIEQDIFNNVYTDGTIFTNKTKQDLNVSGSGSPYTWKGGTFKSVGKWSVDYLDEKGDNQVSMPGLPITASCTTLADGWYFVEYNTNLNHQLTFKGDVKLILGDKATLRITDATNTALTVSGNLTIYSQSLGDDMGSLTAESASSIGINSGIFTVCGGQIITKGNYGTTFNSAIIYNGKLTAEGNDFGILGPLTMNGGKLVAKGTQYNGICGSDLTINGGQVDAIGALGGVNYTTIQLGWTNASDYIYADSYLGSVSIVDGKSFLCNGQTINGAIADNSQINMKTLIPVSTFEGGASFVATGSLSGDWKLDDADIKVWVPTGRIVKNGDAYEMELKEVVGGGIPSSGPVILTKEGGVPANVNVTGTNADEADDIETKYHDANPTAAFFVSNGKRTLNELIVDALGEDTDPHDYVPFTLVDNKLVAASNSGNVVKAGICIFVFNKFDVIQMARGTYNPPVTSAPARSIPFNFSGEATSISEELRVKSEELVDSWYDLQGRRVNKPTKGLYINKGVKVMVK